MEPDRYAQLIARNYDASYAVLRDPSGDIAFYRQLAHDTSGPVLELGCGTGRTLLPIARDGIECVGIDVSAAMLDQLRAKAPPPNLRVVEASMESFDLSPQRFALITCPFRAFGHLLDVDAQLATLARVRAHLRPGGLFALDVFDPQPESMARREEPEKLAIEFEYEGVAMQRWDTVHRDHTRQVLSVRFRYAGGAPELVGTTDITLRWFYRYELEHLLARAGFCDLTFFSTFDRQPWRSGRETIVLARPAP
jgi:SAM-dependent methyltransferase